MNRLRLPRCFLCSLLLPALLAPGLVAQDTRAKPKEPSTCQDVARRELAPFEKALESAARASDHYDARNADKIASLEDAIELRKGFRKRFEDYRRADREAYDTRVQHAQDAIRMTRERTEARIASDEKKLADLVGANRSSAADSLRRQIAALRKRLADGTIHAHQPKLGHGMQMKNWVGWIEKQRRAKVEKLAKHDAGKVGYHMPELGRHYDWQGVLADLAKHRELLAEAKARQPGYHLPPIGYTLNGKGIDDLVAKRKDELADACARIAAGTFRLHVPTLGYTADRNHVQKLIHEARKKYRETVAAWAEKKFRIHNPIWGRSPTNGEIEKVIADIKKKLADYLAAGDDALAIASGRHQRATAIKAAIADARRARNSDAAAYHAKVLAEWRRNREIDAQKLRDDIARQEKALKLHEKLWREELKRQKADIDNRLARALAETPCGGKGSRVADERGDIVDRHVRKLNGLAETEAERRRRIALYFDRIFRERDSTVHGDPKEAWQNALRDLPVGDGQVTISQWILWLKDNLDWFEGMVDANKLRIFGAKIEEFITTMEALDPSRMSKKEFFKQRKQARQLLKGIEEALEGGWLSASRIQRYIDALKKSASGTTKTRTQIRVLSAALRRSQDARRMFKSWAAIKSVASNLSGRALEAYQDFVKGSVDQIAQRADTALAGASKVDVGLMIFSVAAAGANAYEQIQQGVAAEEAIARASVDFVIDLVISGVPILAAAEMATQVLFTSYATVTGDQGVSDATLSNTTKWVARNALDTVASGGAALGRWAAALERIANNETDAAEVLVGVDFARLRQSLSRVEERIAMLPPGHADEARLMRARQSLRILVRAKQGLGY